MGEAIMKFRRWIVRLLAALMILIPLTATALYFVNPFGALSNDPRQRIFGYGPYRIPSRSMSPTVHPDQIVVVNAGYYRKHPPQRGDIVTFIHPEDGNTWIKRVVGLPGESIGIEDGVVVVDGNRLTEDYLLADNVVTEYSLEMPAEVVPENSYFLLGDNRDNSEDARIFGATRREDIGGKVVLIFK